MRGCRGLLATNDVGVATLGTPPGTSAGLGTMLGLATQVLLVQLCTPLVSPCIGTCPLGKREERHTPESLPISSRKYRSPLCEGLASSSHTVEVDCLGELQIGRPDMAPASPRHNDRCSILLMMGGYETLHPPIHLGSPRRCSADNIILLCKHHCHRLPAIAERLYKWVPPI